MGITGEFLAKSITTSELGESLDNNPCFRANYIGYAAEVKLKAYLKTIPTLDSISKIPDLDNRKGDFLVTYKGKDFSIELKMVAKGELKEDLVHGGYFGTVNLKRTGPEILPDGRRIHSLTRNRFDILAVGSVTPEGNWKFFFISPRYIPSSGAGTRYITTMFSINTNNTPHLRSDIIQVLEDIN